MSRRTTALLQVDRCLAACITAVLRIQSHGHSPHRPHPAHAKGQDTIGRKSQVDLAVSPPAGLYLQGNPSPLPCFHRLPDLLLAACRQECLPVVPLQDPAYQHSVLPGQVLHPDHQAVQHQRQGQIPLQPGTEGNLPVLKGFLPVCLHCKPPCHVVRAVPPYNGLVPVCQALPQQLDLFPVKRPGADPQFPTEGGSRTHRLPHAAAGGHNPGRAKCYVGDTDIPPGKQQVLHLPAVQAPERYLINACNRDELCGRIPVVNP